MAAASLAFLVGVLLFGGPNAGEQNPDPGRIDAKSNGVILTSTRPEGSFPVAAAILASSPPLLALHFTEVTNPSQTPFQIFASLSYKPAGQTEAVKILLGNAALYPPDRPGGFVLRTSSAFRKLKASEPTNVRLVLEMKRIHPQTPWSAVEVTVAPPEWRNENP